MKSPLASERSELRARAGDLDRGALAVLAELSIEQPSVPNPAPAIAEAACRARGASVRRALAQRIAHVSADLARATELLEGLDGEVAAGVERERECRIELGDASSLFAAVGFVAIGAFRFGWQFSTEHDLLRAGTGLALVVASYFLGAGAAPLWRRRMYMVVGLAAGAWGTTVLGDADALHASLTTWGPLVGSAGISLVLGIASRALGAPPLRAFSLIRAGRAASADLDARRRAATTERSVVAGLIGQIDVLRVAESETDVVFKQLEQTMVAIAKGSP